MFRKLRPIKLYEATELLTEVKQNPLAFALFNKINKDREVSGLPPLTAWVWRGLSFVGFCDWVTGEIRLSNTSTKKEQLITLIYEMCNLNTSLTHYRNNQYNKLWEGRYPIRREVYTKEQEKFGHMAGQEMLKIYRYGIKHLGWDREVFKPEQALYQRPFDVYYKDDYEAAERHKAYFADNWDEVMEEKEKEKENEKRCQYK